VEGVEVELARVRGRVFAREADGKVAGVVLETGRRIRHAKDAAGAASEGHGQVEGGLEAKGDVTHGVARVEAQRGLRVAEDIERHVEVQIVDAAVAKAELALFRLFRVCLGPDQSAHGEVEPAHRVVELGVEVDVPVAVERELGDVKGIVLLLGLEVEPLAAGDLGLEFLLGGVLRVTSVEGGGTNRRKECKKKEKRKKVSLDAEKRGLGGASGVRMGRGHRDRLGARARVPTFARARRRGAGFFSLPHNFLKIYINAHAQRRFLLA
jgi:hypothetical protein